MKSGNKNIARERIKELTNILIGENSFWQHRYDALQEMHDLFVSAGSLNAYTPDSKEDDKWLENGCAISPKSAAMCLFEIARTQKFVAGLKLAIEDRLASTTQRPIQVLDAGAGPYAIFGLLTAIYFASEEVQYTVLDIHPENIESIHRLVDYLEMREYFNAILLQDATTYIAPANNKPDIIITETMKNGLSKETQVSITLHLSKQLDEEGIFIPQKIVLDLQQVDIQTRKKLLYDPELTSVDYALFESNICTILELDRHTTEADIAKHPLCKTTIPEDFTNERFYLHINTFIQVYKGIQLSHKETSITAPISISGPANAVIKAGDIIQFFYENNNHPQLKFMVN